MSRRPGLGEVWRNVLALPPVWNLLLGRPPRRARLPIDFLPGDIGTLRRRRPAVLLMDDGPTRQRALRVLLETELAVAPVTWLGPDEAAVRALGPTVLAAAQRGRLHALAWHEGAAAALQAHGDARVLRELTACGLRRRELLLVDLLAPALAQLPPGGEVASVVQKACQALLSWAELHPGAPVLALAPTHHEGQALLPLFERSTVPCVAQLRQHEGQAQLELLRWPDGANGTVQDLGFGLIDRQDGAWQADGSGLALNAHEMAIAGDAALVITLPASLLGAAGAAAPAGWQVCAGLAELVAACRYAVAATVLLPHTRADDLPLLVDTVRSLRKAHPHALKIVVREVGASLRYNQELALQRAGANFVLYRDSGFARVQQALLDLRHQSFNRRLAEGAGGDLLSEVAPDPVRGYLPLAAFCQAAERMLERTEPLGMAHCIVQLPLLPEVSHLDALAACHIGRDGDLVTADEQAVWLFLFACRAPDVEPTLKRLFSLPPSALFNQMRVRPEPDAMRRALDRLRRHAVEVVTDYSEALRDVQPARLQVSDSGFVTLQPEGQDTLPAPLDEPPVAPRQAPERIHLTLRP